jgi:uncharacterized protein (TIGR02145 family)
MKRHLPLILIFYLLLFTLSATAQVTDSDGNIYQTVTIGTQVWMKENLKTTKYNDGTSIPNVNDVTSWSELSTGAYCWYNNDNSNKSTYGALYNWYTVNSGKLCPAGWHVPTDSEWTILATYAGGESVAGGKLKETGTTHWITPNYGATNETGFTAVPTGYRAYNGGFGYKTQFGYWWTLTESSSTDVWYQYMGYDNRAVGKLAGSKNYGFSVRCIQNDLSGQPSITSFTPTSGPIGTSATITGSNFSTTPSENIVWFGAVKATVTSATLTSLTVTVPAGASYQPITVTVNGLTAYSNNPFNSTFSGAQPINGTSFNSKVDLTSGTQPEGIAIADIDGDAKPDLIVTNVNSASVSIYRNIATSGSISIGSFDTKFDIPTSGLTHGIAVCDIDGDGKLDIIVTSVTSNVVSIFRNASTSGSVTTGSFAARVDLTTGAGPYKVAAGDVDGDGKPDIVVTNFTDNSVSVFRNTSAPGTITTASFGAKIDLATGTGPIGVAIGDIDGDSKPDLLITNSGSNSVSILKNISTSGSISTSSFSNRVDFTTGTSPYLVTIGDINGDDKPDLAVSNSGSSSVSIFRNTSTSGSITTGSFDAKTDLTTGSNPRGVAFADINGDNKLDLVVANQFFWTVSVLRNTATSGSFSGSSFSAKADFPTGENPLGIAIGDIDCDGKPDIVVANNSNNTVSILQNIIPIVVPPPAPVVGTITHPTCTVSTGSVALSGLPSADTWTLTRYPGGTTTQGTGTSTTISDLTTGSYTYTVTETSGGTSVASSSVVINAQPSTPTAPLIGTITQPICPATTGRLVLSGLPASGTWTLKRSTDNVTTTGSGVYTTVSGVPISSLYYTVTNSSGCTSQSSAIITINSPDGAPATPAEGTKVQPTCKVPTGSVTIDGLPSTGTWTLTMTPGGTTTGTGTSKPLTALSPGTYSFTVTNTAGCTSGTLSNVVIQSVPVGNVPVIEKKWNSVLFCYNVNNVFSTWQWYRGNTLLSGANKAYFYTENIPGNYQVFTSDKDECKNFSNAIEMKQGSKGLSAYPNPVSGNVTISMTDETRGRAIIALYNESGIKVMEILTEKSDDNLFKEIMLNDIDQGVYLVKVTINQKDVYFTRIVVSR